MFYNQSKAGSRTYRGAMGWTITPGWLQDTWLPTIGSWFNAMSPSPLAPSITKSNHDDDSDCDLDQTDEIRHLIVLSNNENLELPTEHEEESLMNRQFAYIATAVDRNMKMYVNYINWSVYNDP